MGIALKETDKNIIKININGHEASKLKIKGEIKHFTARNEILVAIKGDKW